MKSPSGGALPIPAISRPTTIDYSANYPRWRLCNENRNRPHAASEIVSGSDAETIDPGGLNARLVATFENVVQLHLHVRVEKPVEANRHVVKGASLDGFAIEVEIAEAHAELPSPPTAIGIAWELMVVVVRNDPAKRA